MTSQDGLALLKQMHQRGEISDEQYDALRRHVLWGTPLPQLEDDLPMPRSGVDPTGGYVPGAATVGPGRFPDPGTRFPEGPGRYPAQPPGPAPRPYASRRERREAEEARAQESHLPAAASTGPLPPVGEAPPRRRHRRDNADADASAPTRRHRHAPPDRREPWRPGEPDLGTAPSRRNAPPDRREPWRAVEPEPELREAPTSRHAPPEERQPWRPIEPQPELGAVPTRRHASLDRREVRRPVEPEHGLGEAPSRRRRSAAPDEAASEPDRGSRHGATVVGGKKKRRPRRRSVVAVLTSVVLALALAAGGVYWFELRRQGLAPAAYARQACGAVRDWQQAVDSSNARLINQISRQQNKTTVRSDVTAYYTTVAGRTDQLRIAILDLGPADLSGGRQYADSLAAAVGDQATALRRLAGQAGRLDPAVATFPTDLQGVLTGADTAVSAVTAALARPAAGITTDLRTTLSNEPACVPYVG